MSLLLLATELKPLTPNECFEAIIGLLAGLGALLIGFKMLSDNMEKIASGGLKKMFSKVSKSKLAGVGIGAGATAIIQSSSATTVMVVGFVNVGIMSLFQATSVIMGANIGTTITAHIASLSFLNFGGVIEFDIVLIATALTVVGIFMDMLGKKDNVKTIGLILAGLGLVFVGLENMSAAMKVFRTDPNITGAIASVQNPFFALLVGGLVTALVQSSSAVTSIIISMVGSSLAFGAEGSSTVLFLIMGTNIGTCVTAILSAIGASRNAVRACVIHLMFNTFGTLLFFPIIAVWDAIAAGGGQTFMSMTFGSWFADPAQQIAMFHTFFNVICTLIFLPFSELFVKLSGIIIPEKEEKKNTVSLMDKRLLATPAIAIEQLNKERTRMADMSMENLSTAFYGYLNRDESPTESILKKNEEIAALNQELIDYLVLVSSEDISMKDEKIVSSLHHDLGDIERIAEIADNLTKYTHREIKHNIVFSSGVNEQLEEMFKKLQDMYAAVKALLEHKDKSKLSKVDALEEEVDAMRKKLIGEHIERLNGGYCKAENSSIFINLVSNLERVGDHLCYLAHSVEEA